MPATCPYPEPTPSSLHPLPLPEDPLSEPIIVKIGVRQEDALACVLFNVALEKVIRDGAVNIRGASFIIMFKF